VKGGTFEGPKLKGQLLPGGAEWQLIRPDGTTEIDVRLTLGTDDGQFVYMTYAGHRPARGFAAARERRSGGT